MFNFVNDEEKSFFGGFFLLHAGIAVIILSVSAAIWLGSRAVQTADTAVLRYEEFQEIYNTTQVLNNKLCAIKAAPAEDAMFVQISKQAQIVGLQNTLNRWIGEYNAKSAMWNRALWKSQTLPYNLATTNFPCY